MAAVRQGCAAQIGQNRRHSRGAIRAIVMADLLARCIKRDDGQPILAIGADFNLAGPAHFIMHHRRADRGGRKRQGKQKGKQAADHGAGLTHVFGLEKATECPNAKPKGPAWVTKQGLR